MYMTLLSDTCSGLECLHWLMFTQPEPSASNSSVTSFASKHITHSLYSDVSEEPHIDSDMAEPSDIVSKGCKNILGI